MRRPDDRPMKPGIGDDEVLHRFLFVFHSNLRVPDLADIFVAGPFRSLALGLGLDSLEDAHQLP